MKDRINLLKCYDADFSHSDDRLVSIGRDLNMWSVSEGRKVWRSHPLSHPSTCSFSDDASRVVVKNTSGEIRLIDSATGLPAANFETQVLGEGSNIIWFADDRYLIDGSWSGYLAIRDAANGRIVWYREYPDEMITDIYTNRKKSIFISRVAPTIHSKKTRPYFLLWSLPFSDADAKMIDMSTYNIDEAAFNSDLSRVAVIHSKKPFRFAVYDLNSHDELWKMKLSSYGPGTCLAWTPDDEVISVIDNNRVNFLNARNGKIIADFALPFACKVQYSNSMKYLAICSWEKGMLLQTDHVLDSLR